MAFSLIGILAVLLELVRPFVLPIGVLLLVEVVALGLLFMRRGRLRVRPAVRSSIVLGLAVGLLAAVGLPAWTGASLAQLSGWLDYATIIGAGVGAGLAVGLAGYPLLQLLFLRPVRAPSGTAVPPGSRDRAHPSMQ